MIVSNKPSTMFIPDEVKNLPRWNSWQKRFNREDATKKPKKIPYQLNGFAADSNDGSVDQWTTFKLAYDKHLSNGSSGIGFLITMDDPYTGVDIDHCLDYETREINARGARILAMFPGAYAEVSPSGTGIKLLIRGKKPPWCDKCVVTFDSATGERVEVYDHSQFFTITGDVYGDPVREIADLEVELAQFCEEFLPKVVEKDTPQPVTEVEELALDDQGLLDLLYSFPYGDKVRRLYCGDTSYYQYDQSRADLAFCDYLAFVTRDPKTIDRIFRSSGLYRDKWERDSYGKATVQKAIRTQTDFYDPGLKFMRKRIEERYLRFLAMEWKSYGAGLVALALLKMAHQSCNYRGEDFIVDAAIRDIRTEVNLSNRMISIVTNSLHKSDSPIRFLRKGDQKTGVRSKYAISPPDKNCMPNPNIPSYPSYPNPTPPVVNIMLQKGHYLAFSPIHNPKNLALLWGFLQIVAFGPISVDDLYSLMGYEKTKGQFEKQVLAPLREARLITTDKGMLNQRLGAENRMKGMYDQKEHQRVIGEVETQRLEWRYKRT